MKCLILAAGYATRLYPLTKDFPKPLLKVKDKTILDWLVDDIEQTGEVDEYVVISNHKFVDHFEKWAKTKEMKITVVDDLTSSNETRLGAVVDIQFAIDKLNIKDDVLVIAGDNILDFSFAGFIKYSREKNASCIMRYFEEEIPVLQKCGVMEIDETDLVLDLVEKPQVPKTHWGCPPFYIYLAKDLPLIKKGIAEGCATDAPGSLVSWLCKNTKVYAYEMTGERYDIGDIPSYEEVQKTFNGIINE